ncbi:MAG: hypothetical protein DRN08_00130, partial [Thermoplasmata archaeon]
GLGSHSYYFYFEDPHGGSARLPVSGYWDFVVMNDPPVLSTFDGWPDGVDPNEGSVGDSFTFRVHYFDPDGFDPVVRNVVVDGTPYVMDGSGGDADYVLVMQGGDFGLGSHSYYFYFEDPHGGSARLPVSGYWEFTVTENYPPNKPLQPSGPTSGHTGTEYTYSSITYDPNNDNISYWFDWGDGNNTGWMNWVPSGTEITISHTWNSGGYYTIRVKARDIYGAESEWSDPLTVFINSDPHTPSHPYPPHRERGLGKYVTLSWDGGDPNTNDTITYEIYFGRWLNPPKIDTITYPANHERIEYTIGPLKRGTKYYWKIIAIDNHGATSEGPRWWFKTKNLLSQNHPNLHQGIYLTEPTELT